MAVEFSRWNRLAERYDEWSVNLDGTLGTVVPWLGPKRVELKRVLQELDGERVSLLSRNMHRSGRLDVAGIGGGAVTLHVDDGIINLRKSRDRLVLLSDIRYVEHAGRRFGPFEAVTI